MTIPTRVHILAFSRWSRDRPEPPRVVWSIQAYAADGAIAAPRFEKPSEDEARAFAALLWPGLPVTVEVRADAQALMEGREV